MTLMNLIILFIDTKYISFCITAEELNENCCEHHKIKLAKNDLTISSFFNMATYRETKIDQKNASGCRNESVLRSKEGNSP